MPEPVTVHRAAVLATVDLVCADSDEILAEHARRARSRLGHGARKVRS